MIVLTFLKQNIRGVHVDHKLKGPLIHRFLRRYQEQYPSVYFWWDETRQCIWSSILPLAIRQHSETDVINASLNSDSLDTESENVTVPMTDTATLQNQFDLFTQHLDHANSVCIFKLVFLSHFNSKFPMII